MECWLQKSRHYFTSYELLLILTLLSSHWCTACKRKLNLYSRHAQLVSEQVLAHHATWYLKLTLLKEPCTDIWSMTLLILKKRPPRGITKNYPHYLDFCQKNMGTLSDNKTYFCNSPSNYYTFYIPSKVSRRLQI